MDKTLLQIAKEKAVHRGRGISTFSEERLELMVAILKGEITIRQASAALGTKNTGNVTHQIGTMLREGISRGLIEIKWLKK